MTITSKQLVGLLTPYFSAAQASARGTPNANKQLRDAFDGLLAGLNCLETEPSTREKEILKLKAEIKTLKSDLATVQSISRQWSSLHTTAVTKLAKIRALLDVIDER